LAAVELARNHGGLRGRTAGHSIRISSLSLLEIRHAVSHRFAARGPLQYGSGKAGRLYRVVAALGNQRSSDEGDPGHTV
jgi:hypothetical protein